MGPNFFGAFSNFRELTISFSKSICHYWKSLPESVFYFKGRSFFLWWTTYTQPGDPMDYAHTAWRSDGQRTNSLESRWTMYTAQTSNGLCLSHSLEIWWTMHTQSGDPTDYVHIVWRSDGLCTQTGDPMDYTHRVWRSMDYVHGLEIRWIMHTTRRSDGLCTYHLENRLTVYTQTGDQLVTSTSGRCRWHYYSVFARWLMHTSKLVTNKFKINCSSTIRRP